MRKTLATLTIAGVAVWGLGCEQPSTKGTKPAADSANTKKPEEKKPEEKKPEGAKTAPSTPESGSTTGAGGGTPTP